MQEVQTRVNLPVVESTLLSSRQHIAVLRDSLAFISQTRSRLEAELQAVEGEYLAYATQYCHHPQFEICHLHPITGGRLRHPQQRCSLCGITFTLPRSVPQEPILLYGPFDLQEESSSLSPPQIPVSTPDQAPNELQGHIRELRDITNTQRFH